jgi:hypothetical protein
MTIRHQSRNADLCLIAFAVQVDPVIEQMYEVRDYVLNQTALVEDSIDLIDDVVTSFADFAVTTESYTTNVTAGIAEIDDILAYGLTCNLHTQL